MNLHIAFITRTETDVFVWPPDILILGVTFEVLGLDQTVTLFRYNTACLCSDPASLIGNKANGRTKPKD